MSDTASACCERSLELPCDLESFFARALDDQDSAVWLDGRGEFGGGWVSGTMMGLCCRRRAGIAARTGWLERIDRLVRRRLRRGGTARTGVVVLLGYEALDDAVAGSRVVVVEVDASLAALSDGSTLLSACAAAGAAAERRFERLARRSAVEPSRPAAIAGPVRTSLPRAAYLAAVARVKRHVTAGDVYQANLCQRFDAPVDGDGFTLYRRLAAASPAPRSAYLRAAGSELVSISPEVFLRFAPPDRVETHPIKGTRSRQSDPLADRRAALELVASPKDRAELLMIVDLERNDLGRICRTGSIRVTQVAELRSFPAVHHLVARVEGRLRPGVGPQEMIRATFPGGSISGAPKIRARELLRAIEPVPRGFFTGSLIWFGDDGSVDSSILIRTLVLSGGTVRLGAGGGIVADSDPEGEWEESNLKAAPIARALGFDPREAR
ncbi:MAG TPA: anthranilate synthase component I family protein [Candidatus Polarisedimenticolaceae bacterium]|nr:anthranilate synthase component I family protein [Candidatus Polarisedimenticolaceae bacterium]